MIRRPARPMAILLSFAAPLPALAQDSDPMIDTDGDGGYSLSELQAVFPDTSADDFIFMDTDGDGLVSPAEAKSAQAAGLLPVSG